MSGLRDEAASASRGGPILAIDTSGARCSAAIYDARDDAILSLREPEIGLGHAERLMGEIEAVLDEAGLSYADLAAVAVCVGPGSFTGLRVGIAAARGLSLSLAIPALGVTSLAAMAEPAAEEGTALLVARDARRGQLFVSLYDGRKELREPASLEPGDLPAFCHDLPPDRGLAIVGGGAESASAVLGAGRPVRVLHASDAVDVRALARLAAIGPARPPVPLYLREADAKPQRASNLLRI